MTKKVHIIGCDGTWQTDTQENPTNVSLLLNALADADATGAPQIRKHFDGVAAHKKGLAKIFGGITGHGLSKKIRASYLYLAENYNPGDDIVLIGFSRGSYEVRSLAGLIYKCGIPNRHGISGNNLEAAVEHAYEFYRCNLKPNSDEAKAFRTTHAVHECPKMILACFDTVGSLGIPRTPLNIISSIINAQDQFHDTKVNRNIRLALHAVAVDETRQSFCPTPMQKSDGADTPVHTRYFVGDHVAVGGGSEKNVDKPISDIPALWIAQMLAANSNVRFDEQKLKDIFNPNALANKGSNFNAGGFWRFMLKTIRKIEKPEDLHETVETRVKADPKYRPKALKAFIQKFTGK